MQESVGYTPAECILNEGEIMFVPVSAGSASNPVLPNALHSLWTARPVPALARYLNRKYVSVTVAHRALSLHRSAAQLVAHRAQPGRVCGGHTKLCQRGEWVGIAGSLLGWAQACICCGHRYVAVTCKFASEASRGSDHSSRLPPDVRLLSSSMARLVGPRLLMAASPDGCKPLARQSTCITQT